VTACCRALSASKGGRPVRKVWSAIAVIAAFAVVGAAETSPLTEYQIKAAFLYNFAKFVEWPATALRDPRAPVIVGVLGEDPFGEDLDDTLSDKVVGGRQLVVKRFGRLRDVGASHILFISSSERGRLPEILRALQHMSILTVGETEEFARLGGVVNFLLEDNKVRFEVNVDAAERAGLKVSSKLLRLARIVRDR
jgi:hypothetical protein